MNEPNDDTARHVLVVEDDDLVGATLVAMLEDECRPVLVNDVASARQRLETDVPVDIILLDCLLPGGGVSGLLEVADQRGTPVILISGSSQELGRLGDNRPTLLKPFSAEDLTALIHAVLIGT